MDDSVKNTRLRQLLQLHHRLAINVPHVPNHPKRHPVPAPHRPEKEQTAPPIFICSYSVAFGWECEVGG